MRRTVTPTLIAGLTTVMVLVAPAQAGGPLDPVGGEVNLGLTHGLKYVSETLVVGSSGHWGAPYESADVSCGSHSSPWHPTHGGLKVAGPNDVNFLVAQRPMDLEAPFESPDNATLDDWSMNVTRSVVGRSLTGYAICSKTSFKYVATSTPNSSSGERTGSSKCPAGRTLVGGGAFIATSGSYVNSSYPAAGNTWKVRIHDTAGGLGGMSVFATCRRAGDVTRVTKTSAAASSGDTTSAIARCGASRHVIGGGGKMSGSISEAHTAASLPYDGPDADSIPDDGWKVTGYNQVGTDKTLTAYALCVTKG